jgi:hypothetical protein
MSGLDEFARLLPVTQWCLHCFLHFMHFRYGKGKLYKGLFAGAEGGLAASWIMPHFQFLLAHALGYSDPHEGQGEDATIKTAQRISAVVLDHELSAEAKNAAGPIVHYGIRNRHRSIVRVCNRW